VSAREEDSSFPRPLGRERTQMVRERRVERAPVLSAREEDSTFRARSGASGQQCARWIL
jgi:hypothetical protein